MLICVNTYTNAPVEFNKAKARPVMPVQIMANGSKRRANASNGNGNGNGSGKGKGKGKGGIRNRGGVGNGDKQTGDSKREYLLAHGVRDIYAARMEALVRSYVICTPHTSTTASPTNDVVYSVVTGLRFCVLYKQTHRYVIVGLNRCMAIHIMHFHHA